MHGDKSHASHIGKFPMFHMDFFLSSNNEWTQAPNMTRRDSLISLYSKSRLFYYNLISLVSLLRSVFGIKYQCFI